MVHSRGEMSKLADYDWYSRDVRRYFAVACHYFLFDQRVDLNKIESWKPYHRWGHQLLVEGATVVTFNYGLVAERVCEPKLCDVLLPWEYEAPTQKTTWILKLHGSVDWASVRKQRPQEADLGASEIKPCIV